MVGRLTSASVARKKNTFNDILLTLELTLFSKLCSVTFILLSYGRYADLIGCTSCSYLSGAVVYMAT